MKIILIVVFLVITSAFARSISDHPANPPEISDWLRSLKNNRGMSCCDWADGMRLEDPDWEWNGSGYRVRINGDWVVVPDDAVLPGPNKLGIAIVWRFNGHITCFIPGTLS
jgi:hypothetical protein